MVENVYELWLYDALIVSAWNPDYVGLPKRSGDTMTPYQKCGGKRTIDQIKFNQDRGRPHVFPFRHTGPYKAIQVAMLNV